MECNEVMSSMNNYYDDTLSDDMRIEIDKHIGFCYECNLKYSEMNNYFQQLKAFSHLIEKPSTLQNEIAAELMGEALTEDIIPKKRGFRLFKRS